MTEQEAVAREWGDARTLGQRVYQDLQRSILHGQLLPGAKLTLRGLADSLNTSTQPVRQAVSRLAAEGALETLANGTIIVPRRARAELDDIHSMRAMLEGEAAARFACVAKQVDIDAVSQINVGLRMAYLSTDTGGTVANMQRFGLAIARGTQSELLGATIFSLRMRLGPHLAEAISVPEPFNPEFLQFTVHINDQLVLAFRDRDPVRARDLRRADMLTLRRTLYQRLGMLPSETAFPRMWSHTP